MTEVSEAQKEAAKFLPAEQVKVLTFEIQRLKVRRNDLLLVRIKQEVSEEWLRNAQRAFASMVQGACKVIIMPFDVEITHVLDGQVRAEARKMYLQYGEKGLPPE